MMNFNIYLRNIYQNESTYVVWSTLKLSLFVYIVKVYLYIIQNIYTIYGMYSCKQTL